MGQELMQFLGCVETTEVSYIMQARWYVGGTYVTDHATIAKRQRHVEPWIEF
jgi:hypothetical protein